MPSFSPVEDAPPTEGWTAEAKAAFHLRLRARGVRNHAVLRAFEVVPRGLFVSAKLAAFAARDMPLPLPCGQTSHEPWRTALAIEALAVEASHRVLEIGSGSGYATAILAHLAGEVLGLERWAGLARSAQALLDGLGLTHAGVVWADGLALGGEIGRFDRILVHGGLPTAAALDDRLAPNGRMVAGHEGRSILREGGCTRIVGECPCPALVDGLAGALPS